VTPGPRSRALALRRSSHRRRLPRHLDALERPVDAPRAVHVRKRLAVLLRLGFRSGANGLRLVVGFAVMKPGFFCRNVLSPLTFRSGKILPVLFYFELIVSVPSGQKLFDGLANGNTFFGVEILAIDILGALAEDQLFEIDDPARDLRSPQRLAGFPFRRPLRSSARA